MFLLIIPNGKQITKERRSIRPPETLTLSKETGSEDTRIKEPRSKETRIKETRSKETRTKEPRSKDTRNLTK